MSLCGCFDQCSCQLQVEPEELATLSGNGDPLSGGWTLTVQETIFSATNTDGAIDITPGGPYGHSPELNVNIEDSDSVDMQISSGGISAEVKIDPASPVPINVGPDGLSIGLIPASGGDLPTGAIIDFFADNAPVGFLACDGSLVSQATYSTLFAVIGHNGSGGVDPGGGMFQLPDLRGRVSVGLDDMGTPAGDAGVLSNPDDLGYISGQEFVELDVGNLPAHSHTVTDAGHTHTNSVSTTPDHTHGTGTSGRSFVTATTATLTNRSVNTTVPEGVTRWVAGSSGGPTVQQLDLGDQHSIVVSGSGTNKQQLNNELTSSNGSHSHTVTINSASSGVTVPTSGGNGNPTGNQFSIMQPFTVVNKIIKT
jgi:microcystin-dependent protein